MQIFLDFDDVLFNTSRFVQVLKKEFEKNGISEEEFDRTYLDYPRRQKNGRLTVYNIWQQIDYLEKEKKKSLSRLRRAVKTLVADTSSFIFPDVVKFLKTFASEDLYIISYGESELQLKKINNCGLSSYFKKIIIINQPKGKIIQQIRKETSKNVSAYFLDDRVEQIEDAKLKNPDLKTLLVKRPEGRYNDKPNQYCDFTISNLLEAKKIILKTKT